MLIISLSQSKIIVNWTILYSGDIKIVIIGTYIHIIITIFIYTDSVVIICCGRQLDNNNNNCCALRSYSRIIINLLLRYIIIAQYTYYNIPREQYIIIYNVCIYTMGRGWRNYIQTPRHNILCRPKSSSRKRSLLYYIGVGWANTTNTNIIIL